METNLNTDNVPDYIKIVDYRASEDLFDNNLKWVDIHYYDGMENRYKSKVVTVRAVSDKAFKRELEYKISQLL